MMMNYKNIGDTLTTAELNAYASLLAHNKVLNDSFNLKNGKIIGEYGEYTFDLTNASIIDNGVLITDETLSNDITVTLENPTQYASYTLHLTVLRYDEVHLLDEDTPNTETIELTIDLVKDTSVVIPMTDLQEYDVILFDSQITVKHDLPEIKGAYVTSLQLTSDKLIIQNGESATLTVAALDLDSLPVPNKSINLYKDGTLFTTLTTDSNGQATTSVTASSIAEITLVAKYKGTVSSEELVLNSSDLFNLSLISNKDIMQTGETATLTATLLGDDTPLAGESISFEVYKGNVLQETLSGTTGSDGVATVGYTGKGTGKLNIQAYDPERIISSGIFSLIDAIFYDDASTDQSSSYYISSAGGTSISYSDGYYVLSFGTSATYVDLRSITNDVKGKTVNFEVDVVLTGAEVRTRVYNGNTAIKSSGYTTTDGTILLENVEIPSDATNITIRLERRNTSTVQSIKFKNWRVYSA